MKNVLFVAPFSFEITVMFAEAAVGHPGVRGILITQDPLEKFPRSLTEKISGHWRVGNALDVDDLTEAIETISRQVGPIHRLLGTLEQLQVPLAVVRERLGIEGMGAEAATNFRDKSQMKTVLNRAEIPCARHRLVARDSDAWDFVREVGYPIVLKPPAGSGAKGTFSVDGDDDLTDALRQAPPHPARPHLAEEFMQGTEHSFDAVSIGGKMVWHSLTHYLPTPLDAVQNPWIQWCVLLPREVDEPEYDDIRDVASRALVALGMETGTSHMEWFRRPDGSVAINEVGARPGGAQISRLISYAHKTNFYKGWAQVMIDSTFDPPERLYATGAAFLRGARPGRVQKIHGLRQAQKDIGPLVVESNLPRLGQPKSSSYEGEGFVILRHPETRVVEEALHRLISLIRVEMG